MPDVERCIYCGQAIPEGKQICPNCELSISRMTGRKNKKHYKKRITAERFKRAVTASLLLGIAIGTVAGTFITYISTSKSKSARAEIDISKYSSTYSTPAEETFDFEYPNNSSENLDFTPIECALSDDLQEYTYRIATDYGIDFPFAMSIMFCESSFRTDCISGSNDYGLMQINERNHGWLKEQLDLVDISEPHQNIRAGLFMLKKLFEKYKDPSMVAMAYNAGEYGASLLWNEGKYHTQYSNKVLKKADEYQLQIENSIKK